MGRDSNQIFARGLMLLWGAFWAFFVVASELAEPVAMARKAFIIALGWCLIGASTAFAFLRKRGGLYLLVEGFLLGVACFTYFHNPLPTTLFLLLTLAFPPLLAGLLLEGEGHRR